MISIDQEKAAFNARAKAAMVIYPKSKSRPEKIRSIERMNAAAGLAREAMKKARGTEGDSTHTH
jgi:hypothetical protein